MKYGVITSSVVATLYEIEADTQEEAEKLFSEGTYQNATELTDYELDSEEEALEIVELCAICNERKNNQGNCNCTNKN